MADQSTHARHCMRTMRLSSLVSIYGHTISICWLARHPFEPWVVLTYITHQSSPALHTALHAGGGSIADGRKAGSSCAGLSVMWCVGTSVAYHAKQSLTACPAVRNAAHPGSHDHALITGSRLSLLYTSPSEDATQRNPAALSAT